MDKENGTKIYLNYTKDQKNCWKLQRMREKRKANRQRQMQKRKKMLNSMTKEQRGQFYQNELDQQKNQELNLQRGFKEGTVVCIDCGFENQMMLKEQKSLAAQLNLIYGRMRASPNLYQLNILNFVGMIEVLSKRKNQVSWHANFEEKGIDQLLKEGHFGEREVIYLSPDAEEELDGFYSDKVYVIGGLVDGTVNLNQTKDRARTLNVKALKLPLESIREKSRFRNCLNLDTVFNIMDDYFTLGDIQEAIIKNLPNRFKTGKIKNLTKLRRQAQEKRALEKEESEQTLEEGQ